MSPRRPSVRLVAVVAFGIVLAVLSWWLVAARGGPGVRLVRASYDATLALRQGGPVVTNGTEIVLVYLDLKSYLRERQDPAQPFDRRLHAKLVRRLTEAGAKLVVFDILFEAPSAEPAVDRELAEAFRGHGGVILGAEWHRADDGRDGSIDVSQRSVVLPAPTLLEAAAGYGFVFARIDPDFVVRELFPGFLERGLPSLTWAAARHLGSEATKEASPTAGRFWLNYYGPPLTVPHVSFSDALDPAAVPDGFFRGKAVLIGARSSAGRFDERRDEWRSPFSAVSGGMPFMPAVEVHATQLSNLVRGDWLMRPAPRLEMALLAAAGLLLGMGLPRFRPMPAVCLALLGEVILLAGVTLAVSRHRMWFPWLIVAAVQIPSALLGSVVGHSAEWVQQRRRLRRTIREQAALIDHARDAILVTDPAGLLRYANPGATRLYGVPAGRFDPPRIPPAGCLGDPERLAEARHSVFTTGGWTGELRSAGVEGAPLIVESRWTLIRDPAGRAKEILMINTDVTEKKRVEEQFFRAQRMETIGALAGGIAHDLNNALSPILMGIQRLRRGIVPEETRRLLEVMEASTHRGADMVRQVLAFSRGRAGDGQLLAPAALVREMEAIIRETFPRTIRIGVLVPDDLWPVRGHATQIHQVLLNLCVNGRDAMAAGGELSLAADNVELTADDAAALAPTARAGRYVMLLVADTGPGLTSSVRERLFEAFFTTKPEGRGTGLGLSTCATIVRNHGGFIVVKSEPGAGCSFEVYLPAAPVGSPEVVPPTEVCPPGRGELVLVVENEESIRGMIQSGLAHAGYGVLLAGSGVEAAALARRHGPRLKVAVVDRLMADQTGDTTIAMLRESCPGLPVILTSGGTSPPPSVQGVTAGPTVFLSKPFDLDQLLRAIDGCGGSPAG